ncbi:MAG: ThuA domain-containing protein [Clostridia bacterium]|nr:ThuA domain-containing protein [Clostridia bacterium]
MTNKIRLHYLVGDVHKGGHDLHRIAKAVNKMLNSTDAFDVLTVCDDADVGDMCFDAYFAADILNEADVFIFNCSSYRFNTPDEQKLIEDAVANGAGFVFLHGDHPCYWVAAGFEPWAEIEKMVGLMWREKTSHGDFCEAHITVDTPEHPIMQGIKDFDTVDEIFCNCENIWNVPFETLASAYSDERVISRHGQPGTGKMEPILTVGSYGKGRTVNHLLGHVWPFYTGHGLGENTMLSFMPREFRKMLVRSCEWAATGKVERTLSFTGNLKLE